MRKTVETDEKLHPENNGNEETKKQAEDTAEENMKKSKKSHKTSKETEQEQQNDQPVQIEQLQQKIQELEDQNIRLRAEFANYKKRVEREQLEFANYIKGEILKEFMPVIDDFKMMLEKSAAGENEQSVFEGAKLIFEKLMNILKKQGLEKIEALGKEFDPNIHEALLMQPTEDESQHNRVLSVFQEGFTIGEKLVRPTKVIVGQYNQNNKN
jgi:molecular chaperone GrpE